MAKQYLECGKVVSTQGLKGEVRVEPWCDTPGFFLDYSVLYLESGSRPVEVEHARVHKNMVILKLKEVETIEDAVTLRGKILYIDRDDAALEDGEYFVQDLMGLTVRDADSGLVYGKLTRVFQTGANDVYQITDEDGKERLVPAIMDVVVSTDIEGGVMEIRPLAGLFDT